MNIDDIRARITNVLKRERVIGWSDPEAADDAGSNASSQLTARIAVALSAELGLEAPCPSCAELKEEVAELEESTAQAVDAVRSLHRVNMADQAMALDMLARLFSTDGFLRREAQLAGKVLRYALDGHRTDGSPVFDVLEDAIQKYKHGVREAP